MQGDSNGWKRWRDGTESSSVDAKGLTRCDTGEAGKNGKKVDAQRRRRRRAHQRVLRLATFSVGCVQRGRAPSHKRCQNVFS